MNFLLSGPHQNCRWTMGALYSWVSPPFVTRKPSKVYERTVFPSHERRNARGVQLPIILTSAKAAGSPTALPVGSTFTRWHVIWQSPGIPETEVELAASRAPSPPTT